jgi:hypothetical protein
MGPLFATTVPAGLKLEGPWWPPGRVESAARPPAEDVG